MSFLLGKKVCSSCYKSHKLITSAICRFTNFYYIIELIYEELPHDNSYPISGAPVGSYGAPIVILYTFLIILCYLLRIRSCNTNSAHSYPRPVYFKARSPHVIIFNEGEIDSNFKTSLQRSFLTQAKRKRRTLKGHSQQIGSNPLCVLSFPEQAARGRLRFRRE